ncbi:lysine--tRNA ligase [Thiolapillus sp.]|uniref:lysine--tRNA ligase n=1 Tax=Thiolapillus sp. TaxID=2017437 RepID=UPI003AF6A025
MNDNTQDENKLIAQRREKLQSRREQGVAFPNDFRREDLAEDLTRELGDKSKEELKELDRQAKVAGRIMAKRGPFLVIQDMSGQIQFYVDRKGLPADLLEETKIWDIGDIVGAEGPVHKSGKGDLYVNMKQAKLLTKSLRPLPEKWHGLQDTELRYRQRYLDLIMNPESRKIFILRSRMIDYIRRFLVERGFLEVETPMMQVIPGGATARPFVTHHNALDLPLYLRIAPELYLKRLVVGGFEKVFEINRNFRNEGLSTRHNPEFTMLEFYEAYADYHHLMDLTEAMLRGIAKDLLGSTVIESQGDTYDFGKPFTRLTVKESILHFNPDIPAADLDKREKAVVHAERLGVDVKPGYGLGKIQIEIFEKTVEHNLKDPTFITAYPTEVSPLARRNDEDPFVTDRFEFFVGGREIANGFSELNDPEDQAERFRKQVEEKDAGDDEAMHFDEDYVRALEHGLPPTAGEGIGIDRLVMLFADVPSIRDVLLFPHMRPQG